MLKVHTLNMSKIAQFPTQIEAPSDASADPRLREITEQVMGLLGTLSPQQQEDILRSITKAIRPIPAPRAGQVLGTIVRLLPHREEWTVGDVKKHVTSEHAGTTNKEIYNALGYLTRRGHVRRVGYGRYVVDGVGIMTSDDLGIEPARYDDD